MKHEICQYCGLQFANEAGYEHHLKSDFSCISEAELYQSSEFKRTSRGWWNEAKPKPRKRTKKRPPDSLPGIF